MSGRSFRRVSEDGGSPVSGGWEAAERALDKEMEVAHPAWDFLIERFVEKETLIDAQPPWPWSLNAEQDVVLAADGIEVAELFALSSNQERDIARFVVSQDPGVALADLEMRRDLVSLHHPTRFGHCTSCVSPSGVSPPWPCHTVKVLLHAYEQASGFDPAWLSEED